MTAKELLNFCWLAYLDMPPLYISIIRRGGSVPVAALADTTLRMEAAGALECVELNDAARRAAREMKLSPAIIIDYINENSSDGFVAYVIRDGGETVIAMRGSERIGPCVDSNVDWVDNVCEPFIGSVQLDSIRRIADEHPAGKLIFTGHSKGGHNALAALAVSINPEATASAFNGQGFAENALTPAQRERLARRGVNYVVADDVIGALLDHPERRVYVRQVPGTNAHLPEAFTFNADGNPVPARRTLRSRAAEAASRIADRRLDGGARLSVSAICRAALGGR